MRTPSPAEILLFARVLTRFVHSDRLREALTILSEADEAERHVERTGQSHSRLGDGSLMSRCQLHCPASEPMADDRDFLACLALAANAMLAHSNG